MLHNDCRNDLGESKITEYTDLKANVIKGVISSLTKKGLLFDAYGDHESKKVLNWISDKGIDAYYENFG